MNIHDFNDGQMKKFFDAVGCVREPRLCGRFTTRQLKSLVKLNGGLNDWPKFTDDPLVNFAVDCIIADDDEQPPVYDEQLEQLYLNEIEAAKTEGLL